MTTYFISWGWQLLDILWTNDYKLARQANANLRSFYADGSDSMHTHESLCTKNMLNQNANS